VAESKLNELYNLAREGDQAAEEPLFHGLSERFGLFVQHRVRSKQDAEEIVQDTLMAIARKYKKVGLITNFTAWAYKALENNLLYYYRTKQSRAEKVKQMAANPEMSFTPAPELRHQLLECLKKMNRINTRYARILNLHYQGYAVKEICQKLKITENNVYIILSRARSMLKSCLEKGDIE
jgi:RNA polymerase sigma-70 factor (ECF subfamily)